MYVLFFPPLDFVVVFAVYSGIAVSITDGNGLLVILFEQVPPEWAKSYTETDLLE